MALFQQRSEEIDPNFRNITLADKLLEEIYLVGYVLFGLAVLQETVAVHHETVPTDRDGRILQHRFVWIAWFQGTDNQTLAVQVEKLLFLHHGRSVNWDKSQCILSQFSETDIL